MHFKNIIEWTYGIYSDILMNINTGTGRTIKPQTLRGLIFNGSSKAIINTDDVTFIDFQYKSVKLF